MKKLAFVLIIGLIFQLFSATTFATVKNTVYAENVSAKAGETVNVAVKVANSVSFSNLALEIGYDSQALKLTNVTNEIAGASFTTAQTYTANPYNVQWDSASDVSASGTIATFTFKVNENAESGSHPITISYYKGRSGKNTDGDDVNYTSDYTPLSLEYTNAAITVGSLKNSMDVSAVSNGTTITADITLASKAASIGGTVYVVTYNHGQFTSVTACAAESSLTVSVPKGDADTMKVIWTDSDMIPLSTAQPIELK